MTVESASYISQLDTTLPTAADLISEGDDHLRLTKTVLKTQFPNFGTTAITASAAEVNYSVGVTSAIQTQLNGKGAITGQAWAGAHSFAGATSVPTLAAGTNTTGAASTAFVQADFLQKFPNYTAPVTASTTELNYLVGLTGAIQPQLSNQVAGPVHAATSKATPVDADELPISDSAASWALKKLTFANLKAWIGGLFVSKSGDTMTGMLTVPSLTTNGAIVLPNVADISNGITGNTSIAISAGATFAAGGTIVLRGSTNATNPHGVEVWAGGAERLRVYTGGNVLVTGGGGLGYGVGSGGTVTQTTSNTTLVTLNKPNGTIYIANGTIPANGYINFILNNTAILDVSAVVVNGTYTGTGGTITSIRASVDYHQNGSAILRLKNETASNISTNGVTVRFSIFAGSAS